VMERAVQLFSFDDHSVTLGGVSIKFAYKTSDTSIASFLTEDDDCVHVREGDFSRNDREQRSRVALIYDAWLAKLALPEWFRKFLLDIETYRVVSKQFNFKAELKYQLPTGTTSTTPRNSLYNGTIFAVSCKRASVTGRAVILGDDILAALLRALLLQHWMSVAGEFKMVLKASAPDLNGQATLLSRRLITETQTPCMLPKIGKALARFNVRASKNTGVSDSQYMAGKALSYAYEFRHVPAISSAFLSRYEIEDHSFVQLDDLTWFTRTSGMDTAEKLLTAIKREPVTIGRLEFQDWLIETYEIDLFDLDRLLDVYVIKPGYEVIDEPLYELLAIDM